MFIVFLLGIALVAVGVGATFGGGWATVGAVVLLAIGLKVLFMAVMFGFVGRRFRAMRRQGWTPDEGGRKGPWPCGRHSDTIHTRMHEWHEMAHAGADTEGGTADSGDATASFPSAVLF